MSCEATPFLSSQETSRDSLYTSTIPTLNERQKGQTSAHHDLDILFLRRFALLLALLFRPSLKGNILSLYCLLLLVSCLNELVVYQTGLVPSKFMAVLIGRDSQGFSRLTVIALTIVIAAAVGKATVGYVGGLFALGIRRNLTGRMHNAYLKPHSLYRLAVLEKEIDNPDQRIAQDVDQFARTFRLILEELVLTPILIAYYSYQCWTVSGWLGPTMIYAYFIVGSIVSRFFMAPIVPVVFMKEFYEGEFRHHHVRIRDQAEAISFCKGEKEGARLLSRAFASVLEYQRRVVTLEFFLGVATESFSYMGSILSYFIIAIGVFAGSYKDTSKEELGAVVAKNAFLSMYLIYRFSVIVQQAPKFSELAGQTARISQFLEVAGKVDEEMENVLIDRNHCEEHQLRDPMTSDHAIVFDSVSVKLPDGQVILKDVTLSIQQGDTILITGPNGCGKTSLLRVAAGLWPPFQGQVRLPRTRGTSVQDDGSRKKSTAGSFRDGIVDSVRSKWKIIGDRVPDVMFLPQIPYLVCGSLRDQIVYPYSVDDGVKASDQDATDALNRSGLSTVTDRLRSIDTDYGAGWETMLSPGERQKLSFASLFFWNPTFAVLDEATSSMDPASEALVLKECQALGITYISVGHRLSLYSHHKKNLSFDGKGGWELIVL